MACEKLATDSVKLRHPPVKINRSSLILKNSSYVKHNDPLAEERDSKHLKRENNRTHRIEFGLEDKPKNSHKEGNNRINGTSSNRHELPKRTDISHARNHVSQRPHHDSHRGHRSDHSSHRYSRTKPSFYYPKYSLNTSRSNDFWHDHICKSCGKQYYHNHRYNYKMHRQFNNQCPYKRCIDYHNNDNPTNSMKKKKYKQKLEMVRKHSL